MPKKPTIMSSQYHWNHGDRWTWTAPFIQKIWNQIIFWIIVHIDKARLLLAMYLPLLYLIPILSRVYFLKEDTCCCLPSYIHMWPFIFEGKKNNAGACDLFSNATVPPQDLQIQLKNDFYFLLFILLSFYFMNIFGVVCKWA